MKRECERVSSWQRVGLFIALTVFIAMASDSIVWGAQNDKSKKKARINREATAGSNAAQAVMAAQAQLLAAAREIKNLDAKGAGLGGIRISADRRSLELFWKGEPPAEVRRVIDAQEHGGVKIALQPAQYSQRELIESVRAIMLRAKEYPGLVSVGPLPDGSGLEVGVEDTERASSLKFAVPARLVARKGITLLFSRGNDTPPWWAGAVTRAAKPNAGACSTGFAMTQGSTHGLLTAEHCGCGGNLIFNNGVGVPIGQAEASANNNLFTDSLFVIANSGADTYDGGVGTGEFFKPVVGEQSNFPGLLTCTSGAATGVHCGVRIDSVNNAFIIPGQCSTFPFIEGISIATQVDGTAATGVGDSGGPVFTLASDPSTVNAAGMMFAAMTPTACGNFGTTCFNQVLFHDIDTLKSSHNANVLTGGQASGGGGATVISMLVFCSLTLLWALIWFRRRSRAKVTL
jgi:hypothetical protein